MKTRQFYRFTIPSIGAMFFTGLYFVVDGIFVGRGIGTTALASINLAVPFISILIAVSMMITMGGATLTSIAFGQKEFDKANHIFSLSLIAVILFSLILTLISFFFSEPIAILLGATNQLIQSTAEYIFYYNLFGIFFCSSMTLATFVRNDQNPRLAFWGMVFGAFGNILFDWIFIFPLQMGLKGAAIASGLGQVLACFILSFHFLRKKGKLHFVFSCLSLKNLFSIIKTGTPEFITQMSQPVTILCYNYIILRLLGEIGVSAFSVISYILVLVMGIFTGLAQGIQPLLSHSFGKKDTSSELFFFKKGLRLSITLSISIYLLLLLLGKEIIAIFNNDAQMILLGYDCIKIYGISFIFAAINIIYITYYLSTKRTSQALLLSVLRSFIVNTLFIFLIPLIFGEKAIWVGMIVAEVSIFLIALAQHPSVTAKHSNLIP